MSFGGIFIFYMNFTRSRKIYALSYFQIDSFFIVPHVSFIKLLALQPTQDTDGEASRRGLLETRDSCMRGAGALHAAGERRSMRFFARPSMMPIAKF